MPSASAVQKLSGFVKIELEYNIDTYYSIKN